MSKGNAMARSRTISLLVAATLFLTGCMTPTSEPLAATELPAATQAPSPRPEPTATPEPRTLTVFAAASLTDAFTQIGGDFEATHPGVTVVFNFANARALRTQVEEGAVADVFASANLEEIGILAAGELLAGEAHIFARNTLAIVCPHDNPAGLSSPQQLARPGVKIVLGSEGVTAGKAALQVLADLEAQYGSGYQSAVLRNVVSNEDSVKQVIAKVQLGEADAGMVFESDALAAPELVKIEIPAGSNVIAEYPIAVLAQSAEANLAQAFVDHVLSADGQAVLEAWGFRPAR
jgi:molybdate transport system substrate-binding protein